MSPYPMQTDRPTIVATAVTLIERDGLDQLSLGKLASELGIKAPSLYRHIAHKNALLQAVVEQTFQELFRAYDEAVQTAVNDPIEQFVRLGHAHRNFALTHPQTYMLAYSIPDPELAANPNMLLQQAIALQKIMVLISGEARSLAALRGVLALGHGFVSLELNGQFRRGGELEVDFETAVRAYLHGWTPL